MIRANLKKFSTNYEMVDVSMKEVTHRIAVAEGRVIFSNEGFKHMIEKGSSKGNISQIAEIAGILAAKETSRLLPLCHPIPINKVKVEITPQSQDSSILVKAWAVSDAKTGVEMEALTAVSISCLTIYDMCKNFEKNMKIHDIKLISKEKNPIDK